MGVDFRLYLVTDRSLCSPSSSLVTAVELALRGGVRAVQLREKDMPTRELLATAYEMRKLTGRYGAMLFINDRVDIALCVNADGVHLGQSSIPVRAARKVIGTRGMIGASTHSVEEALEAEEGGADFITFGPLYHTPSKLIYGEPVGIEALRRLKGRVSLPVFGIGGIQREMVQEVIDAGAHGIALIRGILGDTDIQGAAESYMKLLA
jgi:thiamine-phosphate pyrophosphorylase